MEVDKVIGSEFKNMYMSRGDDLVDFVVGHAVFTVVGMKYLNLKIELSLRLLPSR